MNSNEKESFTFYIDRKMTVWVRETHEVEAETYDEAENKMIDKFKNDDTDDTFYEQETLYDTMVEMEPGDNDGNPTVELYSDERHEVLIDNVK